MLKNSECNFIVFPLLQARIIRSSAGAGEFLDMTSSQIELLFLIDIHFDLMMDY